MVQIVNTIQEIPEVPTRGSDKGVIPIMGEKPDKTTSKEAQKIVHFVIVFGKLAARGGQTRYQPVRIHFVSGEDSVLEPRFLEDLVPDLLSVLFLYEVLDAFQ
ncbi:hypothetical protein CEXT_307711 [Caerostris extrusa]|uniref:Uncharacterized protein n=1 Tax=Caerostris extrusa TaxID=172846 RepID=A0AAV4XQF9_CAEEX|nr:hypothetical protein CEXT_307711 [Caerostris extrusa]